jgi:hypothetical protein
MNFKITWHSMPMNYTGDRESPDFVPCNQRKADYNGTASVDAADGDAAATQMRAIQAAALERAEVEIVIDAVEAV